MWIDHFCISHKIVITIIKVIIIIIWSSFSFKLIIRIEWMSTLRRSISISRILWSRNYSIFWSISLILILWFIKASIRIYRISKSRISGCWMLWYIGLRINWVKLRSIVRLLLFSRIVVRICSRSIWVLKRRVIWGRTSILWVS